MAIDWLMLWAGGKVLGALAKPILEDLAEDFVKDQTKSLLGKVGKAALDLVPRDQFLETYGRVVRELVDVIEQELQNAAGSLDATSVSAKDVKQFLRTPSVRDAIENAFTTSSGALAAVTLRNAWQGLPVLPTDFDWDFVAKSFNRKLRKLREEDDDLRAVLAAQAARETAENTRRIAGIQPDFDLQRYREALLERYSNLSFDSVDTSGANYDGVKLWSVFVPQTVRESRDYLPQLHELPKEQIERMVLRGELDAEKSPAGIDAMEERRRAFFDQSPRSMLEAVGDAQLTRIVLLGDPGAGKSSLLKHLALEWARGNSLALPLTLLIELKEYDRWDCPKDKSLVRYLHEAQTWHRLDQLQLDEQLKSAAGALLLLDGIDEVFDPARREQVVNDIHYVSNYYPQLRIIVTSRVFGYKAQRLADAEFRHFILQDFDEEQINDFLQRWHATTFRNPEEAAAKQARLTVAIADSRAIRELAGNPLLLTMMAILNRNQELPRERVQLYEQASRLLLDQWDTERALVSHPQLKGHVGPKEKAEMLREIAYAMQSAPQGLAGNLISEEPLETMLQQYLKTELSFNQPRAAARDLIEQLRTRNFILCFRGAGSYSFVHRTFLEYFCATAIHQRFLKVLNLDYLLTEFFAPHWHDERWHEVLCLIAGQVGNSSVDHLANTISFLLRQQPRGHEFNHLFLAARCCREVRNPRLLGDIYEQTRTALERLLSFEFPYFYQHLDMEVAQRTRVRTAAVSALSGMLPPATSRTWLKQRAADDPDIDVRRAAVREIARVWRDADTLEWLKSTLAVPEAAVRQVVIEELGYWKQDRNVLELIKQHALEDEDAWARNAAVKALGRSRRDADTLRVLKQCYLCEANENARSAIFGTLVAELQGHPGVVPWLQSCVGVDLALAQAALRQLGRLGRKDPQVYSWIKGCTEGDDETLTGVIALTALSRDWKDEPDTLQILKERAASASSEYLRNVAIQHLAENWGDDPDVHAILRQGIENGDHWLIAQAGRLSKNSPVLLQALKRVVDSLSAAVPSRIEALRTVTDNHQDDPELLQWTYKHLRSPELGICKATVEQIARTRKQHVDTFAWLKKLAESGEDEGLRTKAAQELLTGWGDHPDALRILNESCIRHSDQAIKHLAIRTLSRHWRDHPDTLDTLIGCMQRDRNDDIRVAALRAIARGWKNAPDTLQLLNWYLADSSYGLRTAAFGELAQGWFHDQAVMRALVERLRIEQNEHARKHFIRELTIWGAGRADAFAVIERYARENDDSDVGLRAAEALATGWRNHAGTLEIVRALSADADEQVRQHGMSILASSWRHDAATKQLLVERASGDPMPMVRERALYLLVRIRSDLDATLQFLAERANLDGDERVRKFASNELAKLERLGSSLPATAP